MTHRVVGVGFGSEGERLFVTRGDANDVDDEPVRAVQVRGVVAYSVPYLGHLNTWVGMNRPGWLLKAVAAAAHPARLCSWPAGCGPAPPRWRRGRPRASRRRGRRATGVTLPTAPRTRRASRWCSWWRPSWRSLAEQAVAVSVRRSAAWSTAVLAALLSAVPAGAAHAADPLELSLDGTAWSAVLPSRLFASPAVIVPGDVVSADLWVRNSSGDPARVDLVVAEDLGVSPGTLAGDLADHRRGPRTGGAELYGPDLAPGGRARITLVVTFDASSQSMSRRRRSVLDAVTLVQTGVAPATAPTARPTRHRTRPGAGSRTPARTSRGPRVRRSARSSSVSCSWSPAAGRAAPSADLRPPPRGRLSGCAARVNNGRRPPCPADPSCGRPGDHATSRTRCREVRKAFADSPCGAGYTRREQYVNNVTSGVSGGGRLRTMARTSSSSAQAQRGLPPRSTAPPRAWTCCSWRSRSSPGTRSAGTA